MINEFYYVLTRIRVALVEAERLKRMETGHEFSSKNLVEKRIRAGYKEIHANYYEAPEPALGGFLIKVGYRHA